MSTAIEEIVQHGDLQVKGLEEQLAASVEQLETAREELANLELARKARTQAIEHARSQVEQCDKAHQQAIAYAKMAQDTPQHQPAIRAASEAKRALQNARKALQDLESQSRETEEAEQKRESELLELSTQLLDQQERLHVV